MIYSRIDSKEIDEKLRKISKNLSDTTPVMLEIGDIMRNSVIKNFEVGGRYSKAGSVWGGPNRWKPIKMVSFLNNRFKGKLNIKSGKRTRMGVVRAARDKKILINRGRLVNSVTVRANARQTTLSTNVAYAAAHNFGGEKEYPITPRNAKALWIPGLDHPVKKVLHPPQDARPFMVIQPDEDMAAIGKICDRFLSGEKP